MSLAANGTGLSDQITAEGASGYVDGTSFAAPMVAGLAALIRARYPQLTARQVVDRITATAAQHASLRGDTVGYGVVDPVAALTRTPAVLPPPSGLPSAADTGILPLPAASSRPSPAGPGALWGGALALLATLVVVALAVGRLRGGWRAEPIPPSRSAHPRGRFAQPPLPGHSGQRDPGHSHPPPPARPGRPAPDRPDPSTRPPVSSDVARRP
jgi:membrane-anchored mycosin MYCP